MKKKYRAAVIGAGGIGHYHILSFQQSPYAEVVAIAEKNPANPPSSFIPSNGWRTSWNAWPWERSLSSNRNNRCTCRKFWTRFFLSPTDFIIGRLTGNFGVTDYTNALKTGCDLVDERWPDFIENDLGIPRDRLPRVVAPGTRVGCLTRSAGEETGLAEGTPVLAGMTDGCASQVATGAVAPGQWNSTLGTTLVIKGVHRQLLRDPNGSVYCHRHPDGYWLPGGASNTGGECIARQFDPSRLDALGAEALLHAPTSVVLYPLMRTGERFPFVKPHARGFSIGEARDDVTLYTACLEGVGYIERLAYDALRSMGAEIADAIHVAGSTASVGAWLQIRADILNQTLLVPANSTGAMGAAVIAAGGVAHRGIVSAARAMVRIVRDVMPRAEMRAPYSERYDRFRAALRDRGYIP
ncbi:MAG: hypothetical protein HY360_21175 [Verrucomicrobia bacterium]|nr:hypothetical protein [Verrucomicrobiota bacterium]